MGELSLLGRSGTAVFLDFSVPTVTVFGSALQLETWYGIVALPYLFVFAKLSICQNGSFFCSYRTLLQQLITVGKFFVFINDKISINEI